MFQSLITKLSKYWLRLALTGGLLGALLLAAISPAQAVTSDPDGNVAAGEVIDDDLILSQGVVTMDGTVTQNLFVTGGVVTINGEVQRDLIANGSKIIVNGKIGGNVIMAGANLELNGTVGGSVFAANYSLVLGPEAVIGSNLYQAGYSFESKPGSTIAHDAQVAGYQALVNGTIERNLNVDAAALEIDGRIGGDILAHVGSPNGSAPPIFNNSPSDVFQPVPSVLPGLRIAEDANLGGQLTYTSQQDQAAAIKVAPPGGVRFTQEVSNNEPIISPTVIFYTWFFGMVQEFITILALGALGLWRLPALAQRVTRQAQSKPLPALGWGFVSICGGFILTGVSVFVVIIVGVLFFVATLGTLGKLVFSVGFSGLSLAFALFWLLAFHVSKVVAAYLVGQVLLDRLAPQFAPQSRQLIALLLGALIYVAVVNIPVFGWLLAIVCILIGAGAMWLTFTDWRDQRRAAPVPQPV